MDDLAGLGEGTGNGSTLFGRGVDELRNAAAGEREAARGLAKAVFREGGGGDHHEVHGDRVLLAPAGADTAVEHGLTVGERAIGDDRSRRWRHDTPAHRRLV